MIELVLALAVGVPMPPKALVVTNSYKPQSITLTWDSPYTNFVLNVGNESRKYSAHIPLTTNSVTVTNLYKTNSYYFTVIAKVDSQKSDYSNEIKWPASTTNFIDIVLKLRRGNSPTNTVVFTNINLMTLVNPTDDVYYTGELEANVRPN
jgi:hypothetical protein